MSCGMLGDKGEILLHTDENRQPLTETSPVAMLGALAITEGSASTAALANTVIIMIG